MNDDREGHFGELWFWANAAGVVLVSLVLLSSLMGLALSIPVVMERSPDVYVSGMDGDMEMPWLPSGPDQYTITIDPAHMQGEPVPVEVSTIDGKVPSMPVVISVRGQGGVSRDLLLHDRVDHNGEWTGWTVIPAGMDPGLHEIGLGYRGFSSTIPIEGVRRTLEITASETPYPLPLIGGGMVVDEVLGVEIVPASAGPGVSNLSLVTGSGGRVGMERAGDVDGRFLIKTVNISSGWTRFNLELDLVNGTKVTTGEHLAWFLPGGTSDAEITDLEIVRPLGGFDELYDQEADGETENENGSLELLAESYHSIIFRLDPGRNGTLSNPGPVHCSVRGRPVHMRPVDPNGTYEGFFRTTGSYAEEGLIISLGPTNHSRVAMERELFLVDRQAPGFTISPDPFSLEEELPGSFTVYFAEGWELVEYRQFREVPELFLDGSELNVTISSESEENGETVYRATVDGNDLLDGSSLFVSCRAEFRMEVTISFIFFSFPYEPSGAGVPIWFMLISASIAVSLIILMIRSLSKGIVPKRDGMEWRNPFHTDSEISILARTFAAALFFSWTVVILFGLLEQPTPVPDILSAETPIWIKMVLLADASVWEEIVARVMFIGLPLLFLHPSGKWDMNRFKVLLGGHGHFGRSEVILILVSSSFFGLAHLGWGPWKVVPTFVTGALFGYIYIKVGLHAAIAMHFLFDYDSFIFDLTEIPYYHLLALYYFSLAAGGFFLASILTRTKRWFESRSERRVDPKWVLVAHSSLTIIMASYLYLTGSDIDIVLILFMVPLLEGAGYFIHRGGWSRFGKVLVAAGSLLTFALAPLGLMWCFDERP